MVVCSFFLKGQCRFGDRCKNEHPKPFSGFGGGSNFGGGSTFGRTNNTSNKNVCHFFLKGECRFGNNCKFSHPGQNVFGGSQAQSSFNNQSVFGQNKTTAGFGGGNKNTGLNRNQNQFSALSNDSLFGGHASAFGSTQQQQQQPHAPASVDPNNQTQVSQIQQIIRRDMEVWETSNQWPLSCYTFLKEESCLPGLEDFSFEEIRKEAYDANKNSTLAQYAQGLKSLLEKNKQRRMELKNINLHQLQSEIKASLNKSTSQPSSMSFGTNSHSGSLFGSSTLMNQSQSLFGAMTGNSQSTELFGNTSSANQSAGLFGNKTNSSQTQGLFGSSPGSSQSQGLFSSSSAPNQSTSLFSNATGSSQSQGLFGASANTGATGSLFGGPQKPFGNTTTNQMGQSGGQTGTSLFGSTGKSLFETSTSTAPLSGTTSLFGAESASVFGSTTTTTTGQPGMAQQSGFGSASTVSGKPSATPTTTSSSSTSSLKCSEEDLAAYKADHFVLGKIPECPPPPELCST